MQRFRATYIDLLDVNDESVITKIANDVGLNSDRILKLIHGEAAKLAAVAALAEYEQFGCPGVPTWVVEGERFWGKDRVDWFAEKVTVLSAKIMMRVVAKGIDKLELMGSDRVSVNNEVTILLVINYTLLR